MTTAAICATRDVFWRPSFYRGEQYDSDLGLYYLRARYYNPISGRFVSRDPVDDPSRLHKYLYAGGNPVNRIDPSGREDLIEYRPQEGGEAPAVEKAGAEVEDELEDAEDELCEATWPGNVADMNDVLGVDGTPIPDGTTLGRNKTIRKLAKDVEMRFEQHPYFGPEAPACETLPHWQIKVNGRNIGKWMPGTPIP